SLEDTWSGNWAEASSKLSRAADSLMSHQSARGYRATLIFRAAVLSNKAGRIRQNSTLLNQAEALAEEAVQIARPSTWMNQYLHFESDADVYGSAATELAVNASSVTLERTRSYDKWQQKVDEMHAGLNQTDHKRYEPALATLGAM